jgi:hypothetical protein
VLARWWGLLIVAGLWLPGVDRVFAVEPLRLPAVDADSRLRIKADQAWRWSEGDYDVYHLRGACEISQSGRRAQGREVMLWISSGDREANEPTLVIAYLEGDVLVEFGGSSTGEGPPQRLRDTTWLGRFYSYHEIEFSIVEYLGRPVVRPNLYERMQAAHTAGDRYPVQHAQYELPPGGFAIGPDGSARPDDLPAPPAVVQGERIPMPAPVPQATPLLGPSPAPEANFGVGSPPGVTAEQRAAGQSFALGVKTLEVLPRSTVTPPQVRTFNEGGFETTVVARGGVTVVVRDVTLPETAASSGVAAGLGGSALGNIQLSADTIVAWLPPVRDLLQGAGTGSNDGQMEAELYLQGNIVVQQGGRTIYAERMYYNVAREYGVVLSAELISPLPQYPAGFVRLKADVLQQLGRQDFVGYGAAATTSRLGVPRYWLQSNEVTLHTEERTMVDQVTGVPVTALAPELEGRQIALTSRDNFVYVGGFPALYWPTIATDLTQPGFYLTGLKVKNDSIFGTQFLADWDMYQLLGLREPPRGTEWTLSTDYLSQRGPALGTNYEYTGLEAFGHQGPTHGMLDIWGIYDTGLDTLGRDRADLVPPTQTRGRVRWRHRQEFSEQFEFVGQFAAISDRNFLEQYLENEWDWDSDQVTALTLNHYGGSRLFSVTGAARIDNFVTQTNWWPRADYYGLGLNLIGFLTSTSRTQVGYTELGVNVPPTDPRDRATWQLLPWEVTGQGIRAAHRHELAIPFQVGAVRVAPYALGEVAYWGQDLTGNDVTRLFGQAGVRASLPMWSVDQSVNSELFNLRGLAHKVEWYAELFTASATEDYTNFQLYDPVDDDSQEDFRRRFIDTTFGGVQPFKYDERSYFIRQGLQRWVTSPSTELVSDLAQARLGLSQRWQTRRGLPGRERIVDLVEFDTSLFLFPDPDRDNFGQIVGPAQYDFRYNIGDRVALLSDGYADFFSQGLRTFNLGMQYSRPAASDFYLGVLSIEGPISSTILNARVDYRLDEKWIVTGGAMFDFGNAGNVGEQIGVTRIGESALVRMAVNFDPARENVSFSFMIEPRFWPRRRLGQLGGQLIPPPGAEGLE